MQTLYTFRLSHINYKNVLNLFSALGIQYVVDIRRQDVIDNSLFTVDNLVCDLSRYGIKYVSFQDYIRITKECYTSRGIFHFSRFIASNGVQKGIERLKKGLQSNCIIALFDCDLVKDSLRYKLYGKVFTEMGYSVLHFNDECCSESQSQIDELCEREKQRRKDVNYARQTLGKRGEELAVQYLTDNGFTIIEQNWNLHKGCEIDIIAQKNKCYYFVEVKTRSSLIFGHPEQAIDRTKISHIYQAISSYRSEHSLWNVPYHVSSMAIILSSKTDFSIKFYEEIRGF